MQNPTDSNISLRKAFRTIVTMLSLIQSERADESLGLDSPPPAVKQQLELLNSFAHLGNRNNDVVAVAAKPDGLGNLQVIASFHSIRSRERLIGPQQPPAAGFFSFISSTWNSLCFSRNARAQVSSSSAESPTAPQTSLPLPTSPTLVDPETSIPQHLKDCHDSSALLESFLVHEWWVCSRDSRSTFSHAMHYRPNLQADINLEGSFNIHIWMIGRLVVSHPSYLALYIVASCYEKMLMRMTYRTAQALIKDLRKIQMQNIAFSISREWESPNASERMSDQGFLQLLRKLQTYGSHLLKYIDDHQLKENDFYTRGTCQLFHQLLYDLLLGFLGGLKGLTQTQKDGGTTADVMKQLETVVDIGSILRLMVRGAAIKTHFRIIENHLLNLRSRLPGSEEEEEEIDATQSPWNTSVELLKMTVIYFDAIQILAHAVEKKKLIGPDGRVNIIVLHQPPPRNNEGMLIWQDLLRDDQLFPIPMHTTSAEDIIKFLDPADSEGETKDNLNYQSVMEQLVYLGRISHIAKDFGPAVDRITSKLENMTNCTSSGTRLFTDDIISGLKSLKIQASFTPNQVQRRILDIRQNVKTLQDNAKLYKMLRPGTPLSTGVGAKGVIHCELTIMLHLLTALGWEGIVSFLFPLLLSF
jgi:hypothetical protein